MTQPNELALTRAGEQPLPVATRPAPSVGDMLAAVIEKGVTAENVAAVEQIVHLYERMQDKEAEKAFVKAFVALQAELPKVRAIWPVPTKDGRIKYRVAQYHEIMEQVSPVLQRNGFAVSFSTRADEKRIFTTCTLQHIGGHAKSNEFAARVGKGPDGCCEYQADGAAATYGKGRALCCALNIVIDQQDDARAEGPTGTVTEDQAFELERRVAETNSDVLRFLKLAGTKTFADIPAAKYNMLDQLLRKKEGGR